MAVPEKNMVVPASGVLAVLSSPCFPTYGLVTASRRVKHGPDKFFR